MLGQRPLPQIRRIRRPATEKTPEFDLTYVRSGPETAHPIVVIPGGPGLGSILPYRKFRRMAAQGGLDLIMVEHRGIGFSRRDVAGRPLPHSAMWVTEVLDDLDAVLQAEHVDTAFVAGSSYGSYLAASFGARYPNRVAGMLLDSTLQSTADLAIERRVIRELFWEKDAPAANPTVTKMVRELASFGMSQRNLLDVVRAAYEFGGYELLEPLLRQRTHHRISPTWSVLRSYAARDESIVRIPGYYEFGIAGAIGFRELNYGAQPDGQPLDPALTYAALAPKFPAFAGEPYNLPEETQRFTWPLAVLSGSRDIRTPPVIAQRVVEAAQNAVHIEIENGHSALETHPAPLLNIMRQMTCDGAARLPEMANRLNLLPHRGAAARFPHWLARAVRLEQAVRR